MNKENELEITPETVANRFAMGRFRTPGTNPDGMDSKEFFDFLLEDIGIVARKEAIAFAEWVSSNGYQQYDGYDRWISPTQSRAVYETPTLYTMYQQSLKHPKP